MKIYIHDWHIEIYRTIKTNKRTVSRMAVVRPDPVTS